MSLFNTEALNATELKPYFSSIDKDYKPASLASFFLQAEETLLVPRIGLEMYNQIHDKYKAGTLSDDEKVVFGHLQNADLHLALMLSADSGSFRIADTGFYIVANADKKPVSDKKMLEFKKARRETGYQALESAVTCLEKNLELPEFALYKASDAHFLNRAYFINDSQAITAFYRKFNGSAYLFTQITDSISFCERKYLRPVLGAPLFNDLKAKLLAGTLSAAEKQLIREVQRPLTYYTMARALPGLSVQLDPMGMLVSSMPAYGNSENVESKTAASAAQIGLLVDEVKQVAEVELAELESYLLDNAAKFPLYTPPEADEDPLNINSSDYPNYYL
jgi:hypothetical protein